MGAAHRAAAMRTSSEPEIFMAKPLLVSSMRQMEESHCVSLQDAVTVGGRQIKLVQNRRRIFNILGGEIIRADHNPVRPNQADKKAEGLRIINQIIVMEAP